MSDFSALLSKELDTLQSARSFDMDSFPLVEDLQNNLILDGYESINVTYEQLKKALVKSEQTVLSLKKENSRLLQENKELQSKIIVIKEESDLNTAKWQTTMHRLQSELETLKLITHLQEQKLKKKEEEEMMSNNPSSQPLRQTNEKGIENQDPNSKDLIHRKEATEKVVAVTKKYKEQLKEKDVEKKKLRRQVVDLEKQLPKEATENIDIVAKKYQEQLREKDFEKKKLRQQVLYLEKQLTDRNAELNRLNTLFKGAGSHTERIPLEYNTQQQAERLKKQDAPADLRNARNCEFEEAVKKAKDKSQKTEPGQNENVFLRNTTNKFFTNPEEPKKRKPQRSSSAKSKRQ